MIAAYQRISRSDRDLEASGKDVSNSIGNQQELIRKYISKQEEFQNIPVMDYVDDGYTGTNFDRPAFQKMMDGVRSGMIDTIIVKDLSRFGRDYIGVGEYMEQIFPLLGVRFIAINDNYDSNRYLGTTVGLDVIVSNLVNTMYCRDAGKKLRTANEVRWKKGISTSGVTPFGYLFDPNQKGHFIIDPPAAKIVRRVFDLALMGLSAKEIAICLNNEDIPVPSVYNREHEVQGKLDSHQIAPKVIWNTHKIGEILKTYEYTGAMVMGKSRGLISGKSMRRKVPLAQRYITENTHEAIVSHEEYEKAQLIFRECNRSPIMNTPEFPLRKKIRCGNCHRVMMHDFRQIEPIVYCREGYDMPMQTECPSEQYIMSDIENAVFRALREELALLERLEDGIRKEEQDLKRLNQKAEREKQLIEQNIRTCKGEKMRFYEEYAAGNLVIEDYQAKKQDIDRRIAALQGQLEKTEATAQTKSVVPAEVKAAAEQAETFLNEKRLTANMVSAFIENVFVYSSKKIEVRFKFEDAIQSAAHELHIE